MNLLITGGAGFIGSNSADYFASKNHKITILDNLSRKGAANNLKWLIKKHKKNITFIKGNVQSPKAVKSAIQGTDAVLHLAGQTAVTTSIIAPQADFRSNLLGTFTILETIRKSRNKPSLIFSSTNKVYGSLDDVEIKETDTRYEYSKLKGVTEDRKLEFHTPYGCSKGAGDQYVLDYARQYDLNTLVFRQSCIYGVNQLGAEDQGWISWFCKQLMSNHKITIFGDGKQVRDALYITDLVELYAKALKDPPRHKGEVFNIGGGPKNTLSVLETINIIKTYLKIKPDVAFGDWRPSDQKVFITDIGKAKKHFKWSPKIGPKKGIKNILQAAATQNT
jgi:CDP-paratose 2-epimerase